MTDSQAELDPRIWAWVERLLPHLYWLTDDYLLLEAALNDLQDFYDSQGYSDPPKDLRRALVLMKHVVGDLENALDDLTYLRRCVHEALEASPVDRS